MLCILCRSSIRTSSRPQSLLHHHSNFITAAVVGLVHHRRVYPKMYPRAVCLGPYVWRLLLVFMASAMTPHHYLTTSHSENPNPLEYSFRVLHILTINMLNKIDEFGVTHRPSWQGEACPMLSSGARGTVVCGTWLN